MDDKEYRECMSHIDITEILMRSRKPRQMAAEGNTEDAIACAMSEGIRIGWDAHKKMMEEKTKS